MSARRRLFSLLCLPMLLLGVSACEGILSGIYDHPSTDGATHEGFTTHDAERRIERLYVDVVSYKDWSMWTCIAAGPSAPWPLPPSPAHGTADRA